jgi:hypothetical protein
LDKAVTLGQLNAYVFHAIDGKLFVVPALHGSVPVIVKVPLKVEPHPLKVTD